MLNENLYDSIFHRKSIRNYDMNSDLNIEKVKEILDNTERLNKTPVEFKIITSNYLNTIYMKPAPYYIAAFSENSNSGLNNIGFILEQLDLYFSKNNIGACWEGIPRAKNKLKNLSELKYGIVLAFGKTKEKIHRKDKTEFIRKPLDEISNFNHIKDNDITIRILESLQYAPSASNTQPWYVYFNNNNSIDYYCKKPSFIDKKIGMGNFNQIDAGIGLLCLCLGIKNENKKYTINFDDLKNNLDDYSQICTINIE